MSLKEELKFLSTIEIYELVLSRSISRFPEFFWEGSEGQKRGLECLEYLLFTKLGWSYEDVPKKFSKRVLINHKLAGMLSRCFHNSPLECILTFMGDRYKPWEYNVAPRHYWTRETGLMATQYMIESLNWNDEDIKEHLCLNTFKNFGLLSMLMKIYNASPYKAIDDLFPNKFKEWELRNVPLNFWNEDRCKEAILWVIDNKLGDNYKTMSFEEIRKIFIDNGLGYILKQYFNSSIKKMFFYVGIDISKNKKTVFA